MKSKDNHDNDDDIYEFNLIEQYCKIEKSSTNVFLDFFLYLLPSIKTSSLKTCFYSHYFIHILYNHSLEISGISVKFV